MYLQLIKSLAIIFIAAWLFSFVGTTRVLANAPGINGYILDATTNAPIAGVWVKWEDDGATSPDNRPNAVRYEQTDVNGYYSFSGWQNLAFTGQSYTQYTQMIDPALDGNFIHKVYIPCPFATPNCWQNGNIGYPDFATMSGAFSCFSNYQTISVVLPKGWQGYFDSNTLSINNGNPDKTIKPLYFHPIAPPKNCCSISYTDVTAATPGSDAINKLSNACIFNGDDPSLCGGSASQRCFLPTNNISRIQAVSAVARYHGNILKDWNIPAAADIPAHYFQDVNGTRDLARYIVAAANYKFISSTVQCSTIYGASPSASPDDPGYTMNPNGVCFDPYGTWNYSFHGVDRSDYFDKKDAFLYPPMAPETRTAFAQQMYTYFSGSKVVNACINPFTITPTPQPSLKGIVSGTLFIDANSNFTQEIGEADYTSQPINITVSDPAATVDLSTAGEYTISGLNDGTYTVSLTTPINDYRFEYPRNGPPPSFTVTVGANCTTDPKTGAYCDNLGGVHNLNFALQNHLPWMQYEGLDARFDNGFSDPIPPNPNPLFGGAYAAISGTTNATPGITFLGDTTADFGSGNPSTKGWIVQRPYPETYTPSTPSTLHTSYDYLSSLAQNSGITPINLQTVSGCSVLANCSLPANLPNGIYKANAAVIFKNNYTFPSNKNYIFLINGDLTLANEIHIPNGSTAIFASTGNITVSSTVGGPAIPTASEVEGYYIANGDFIIQGNHDCSKNIGDAMLGMQGAIVTNASFTGDGIVNQRDLCAANGSAPTFLIHARPDFILNLPEIIKQPNTIYQEVAP